MEYSYDHFVVHVFFGSKHIYKKRLILIKLKIAETKQKKAKKDLDKTIQQSNIIEKRTRVQNIPNKSRSNIPRNTPRRKWYLD